MSIGPINLNGASAVQPGHGHGGHGGMLKSVAAALGMSTADLRTQLQSGKSLDDVAKDKGVSHADLLAAIKKGLPSDVASSANADQVAEDISTRKGLPPRPPKDSGASPLNGVLGGSLTATQSKVLDALSSALGTDTPTLVSQLQSGASLSSLAAGKGVDGGKLADILQNGLLFDAKA